MDTSVHKGYASSYNKLLPKREIWKKFITWVDNQEETRFGWTAFSIIGHGCVFTVITVAIILATGNNFIFWPFAIAAMAACLIVNLAALPTKITIPVLFFSILLDLEIIALCFTNGVDLSASYR
jgi:hypothetical protein